MQLTFNREVTMRSVDHAAELAGGYEALAKRLFAREEQVIAWSRGSAVPDTTSFLIVLDVIMQETQKLSSAAQALELAQYTVRKAQKSSKTA